MFHDRGGDSSLREPGEVVRAYFVGPGGMDLDVPATIGDYFCDERFGEDRMGSRALCTLDGGAG